VNNYRKVKISEIAEVIGGGTPSTRIPEYWEGNISWLTPKDLTNYSKTQICNGERNITELGLSKSSARLLDEGAVLLTSRAPIGYVAIAGKALATNQGFKSLIVKPKLASNYYLYYWLKGNTEYLNSLGTGTTFAEISGSVIKDIEITLPPLKEQQAIAEVLSSIDDKIDLLHRNNKTLEEMAETLFRQWFVEGAKEDWEEYPLDNLAEYLNGLALQKFPAVKGQPTIPAIKIREMNQGLTDSTDRVSPDIPEKYLVYNGDILFSWSGSLDVIIWSEGTGALNQHLFKVIPKILPKWLVYFATRLFLPDFRDIANDKATTMGHIQRHHLSDAKIKLPDFSCIPQYDKIIDPIFSKLLQNKEQINKLKSLRDSLLPKLMTGQVRVNV
jgi:type I restriction enzyme S subunit